MSQLTASLTDQCTFAVDDVQVATKPLTEIPYSQAVAKFLGGAVESCSSYRGTLINSHNREPLNPLIEVVMWGYCRHHPIVLTPDVIWLTIAHGLACHINLHAEQLRSQFVSHEGQATIRVRRDDFIKGSPENPWPEVFSEFTAGVRKHIGDENYQLIVSDFSTTGPVERAASEIVLLDAMQKYFRYEMVTMCGIPTITLTGTVEDWERILARTQALARFELSWWMDALVPILKQFVAARQGDVDVAFWQSIFHNPRWKRSPYLPISSYVSGWIINFFPYMVTAEHLKQNNPAQLKQNEFLGFELPGRMLELAEFPARPARAPFIWRVRDREFQMEFSGGMFGVRQDPDSLTLKPDIGWAIRDVTPADLTLHA